MSLWRVQAARALAWALLLGGWIGLASLAQAQAATPLIGFALLAGWLLALGAGADIAGRLALPPGPLRALLIATAALAVWALHAGVLMLALIAWALVVALASVTVRACRRALRPDRTRPPVMAAAVGALLAWACVGDIGNLQALVPRLMALVGVASLVLAALLPQRPGKVGPCRAGLFDCSLPSWSRAAWREPGQWPLLLSSLVMLPMMCSLPLMVSLCRSDAVSARIVLAVHFAAMFGPALWIVHHRKSQAAAPSLCAALLALGGLILLAAPGPSAWWGLALAHGSAWSVAWAAQLTAKTPAQRAAPTAADAALRGAACNAVFALALGFGLDRLGLQTLSAWHMALGLAGLLSLFKRSALAAPRPCPASPPGGR